MDPLETLINEHGLIRQFLDNLALAGTKIEEGQRPSRAFFEKAIDFARTFADKYHHFKEEHVLFIQLAQKKQGEVDGQLEALRFQHERGRELVTNMANSLDGYAEQDPMRTTELLENLAAYVSLLRHHIHTEDHVFYPLARNTLSEDEFKKLQRLFDEEREKQGVDTFELSHKAVTDMGSILVHLRQSAEV